MRKVTTILLCSVLLAAFAVGFIAPQTQAIEIHYACRSTYLFAGLSYTCCLVSDTDCQCSYESCYITSAY